MVLTHIVSDKEAGMTLQHLLRSVLLLSSRQTRIAKQQGAVTVNDAPFFANQPLAAGMVVRVALSDFTEEAHIDAALPPVQVLYEDDALIAVFKPAPLQCHPSPSAPRGTDTLEARVAQHLGRAAHPVHRLDAETTGVVLFAKLPFAQAHLQQQMQEGSFKKRYLAWCFGIPKEQQSVIDAPIARQTPDSFTRVVCENGQRAVSQYETLRSVRLSDGSFASLLSLAPITGRTHQLRVHMTHIGCPLLGDTRYFTSESRMASQALSLPHHQLCAVSISFLHPANGESMAISCDPAFLFAPD